MASKRTSIRVSAILLCSVVMAGWSEADEYLSNLGNRWVDPANPDVNSIGDIHALFPGYEPFALQFFPGSGSDQKDYAKMYIGNPRSVATNSNAVNPFRLNAVTFEFIGGHLQVWSNLNVQLYQQVETERVLVGGLGNPVVNPARTQWPESVNPSFCTTYVDYHPLGEILLQPSAEYWCVLTVATDVVPTFGLLFSLSPKFVTSTDWRMGQTTTHDPWAAGEYLKFAVNATLIQETNSTGGLGANSTGVAVSNVRLSASMMGSNIVLSWPASTAASQLYSAPSFGSGAWSPVSTQPVVINDNFVVTLPFSGSGSYFRLQAH